MYLVSVTKEQFNTKCIYFILKKTDSQVLQPSLPRLSHIGFSRLCKERICMLLLLTAFLLQHLQKKWKLDTGKLESN